jgi:hypothetical protein
METNIYINIYTYIESQTVYKFEHLFLCMIFMASMHFLVLSVVLAKKPDFICRTPDLSNRVIQRIKICSRIIVFFYPTFGTQYLDFTLHLKLI